MVKDNDATDDREIGLYPQPVLHRRVRPDGSELIWQEGELPPVPRCITERFMHWAAVDPERLWMAERDGQGGWRCMSYGAAAGQIRSLAAALLAERLTVERPLLILSGNAIAHALMALAAQHVGIPSAALAPAYTLAGEDHGKLLHVRDQLTPGMVFADHAERFLPAIEAVFPPDVTLASVTGASERRRSLALAVMLQTPVSEAVEVAHTAVGQHTIAKFLFTSGTTGKPKAVIQTHGMLCTNQAMVQVAYGLAAEPPILADWAPWNHTASGNKVFYMALYNGGSYYIDDGRPTPEGISRTLRTIGEVAPTWYFNVPIGYQSLLAAMEKDEALAVHFFSRLRMMMYAGAGMGQRTWDRLSRLAARHVPGGVPLVSGLGATETGPFALYHTDAKETPGNIGVPALGVVLKLVPHGDRLEARLKSPSVTPGYWRDPVLTAEAFDEEGFYKLGDALRYARPDDPAGGFLFDGRLAENFKLTTGTWVTVGALRAALIDALGGLALDVVIAGEGQEDLRALLVPNWQALRELAGADLPHEGLARHAGVVKAIAERLAVHARAATGSASRVVAALLMLEPLRFDRGEVTDKGSVNQRAVLRERTALVAALYAGGAEVIEADWKGAGA